MKKHTVEEVAHLLANKTHCVYCDINEFELLRKILKLAFPKDEETDSYPLEFKDYHGYCKHDSNNWANTGKYLEELEIINLSEITDPYDTIYDKTTLCFDNKTNEIEVKDAIHVQAVTISKEDYDRFLMLENKAKKSDQKFIDKCAISAIQSIIKQNHLNVINGIDSCDTKEMSEEAYIIANAMLTQRNKNK